MSFVFLDIHLATVTIFALYHSLLIICHANAVCSLPVCLSPLILSYNDKTVPAWTVDNHGNNDLIHIELLSKTFGMPSSLSVNNMSDYPPACDRSHRLHVDITWTDPFISYVCVKTVSRYTTINTKKMPQSLPVMIRSLMLLFCKINVRTMFYVSWWIVLIIVLYWAVLQRHQTLCIWSPTVCNLNNNEIEWYSVDRVTQVHFPCN